MMRKGGLMRQPITDVARQACAIACITMATDVTILSSSWCLRSATLHKFSVVNVSLRVMTLI